MTTPDNDNRPWPPKAKPNRITQVVGPWTRSVIVMPAWSQRAHGPKKIDYGVRTVVLDYELTRAQSGVAWSLSTGWHWKDLDVDMGNLKCTDVSSPSVGPVEIHSPVPRWDGHVSHTNECPVTDGACYYDVGYLLGNDVFKAMLYDGAEGVWKKLEELWTHHIGGKLA